MSVSREIQGGWPMRPPQFVPAEHEGHLLSFVGVTHEAKVVTRYGESEAARVETLICLDDMFFASDALVFGVALVRQLCDADEDIILGRLEKGTASPGRSAPWKLEWPTEEDFEIAEAYFLPRARRYSNGDIVIDR